MIHNITVFTVFSFKNKIKTDRKVYIHSSWLGEDVCVYVHHKVAACRVLHDKTRMFWGLETGKQVHEEGMLRTVHCLENALFTHQTEGETETNKRLKLKTYFRNREGKQQGKSYFVYLSTSSLATMSPFFRALMAYILPDFLYSANRT